MQDFFHQQYDNSNHYAVHIDMIVFLQSSSIVMYDTTKRLWSEGNSHNPCGAKPSQLSSSWVSGLRKKNRKSPKIPKNHSPCWTLSLPASRWSCSHPRPVSPEQVFVGPFGCFWKILLLRKRAPFVALVFWKMIFWEGPFWKDSLNNPCF